MRQVQQVRPSPVRPRHFPSSASGAQGSLTTEQAASPLLFGDPAGAGPERKNAGVMELVDVADSKSAGGDTVWVRVPPPAPALKFPVWHESPPTARLLSRTGNFFAFGCDPLRWARSRGEAAYEKISFSFWHTCKYSVFWFSGNRVFLCFRASSSLRSLLHHQIAAWIPGSMGITLAILAAEFCLEDVSKCV